MELLRHVMDGIAFHVIDVLWHLHNGRMTLAPWVA